MKMAILSNPNNTGKELQWGIQTKGEHLVRLHLKIPYSFKQ